jgi:hypothetical protein
MQSAFCLITYKPNHKLIYLDFINKFINYDVYLIIDDNCGDYTILKETYKNITFVMLDNNVCLEAGYKNSNFIALKKLISGWDKAIYYFTNINTQYKNVWFSEDDVFFNSENTLLTIDNKYKDYDILCNSSYDEAKLHEWLWKYIKIQFPPPYYCGMMCIIRLSDDYLKNVIKYVNQNETMFFLEAFFPTIAKHYNMKIFESPSEFITVTYRDRLISQNIIEKKENLYHPMKIIQKHINLREMIYLLENKNKIT